MSIKEGQSIHPCIPLGNINKRHPKSSSHITIIITSTDHIQAKVICPNSFRLNKPKDRSKLVFIAGHILVVSMASNSTIGPILQYTLPWEEIIMLRVQTSARSKAKALHG